MYFNNNFNSNFNSNFNGNSRQPQPKPPKPKQLRMSLSFKDDEKWLFDTLQAYSCPTGIIKDVLKAYFKGGDING